MNIKNGLIGSSAVDVFLARDLKKHIAENRFLDIKDDSKQQKLSFLKDEKLKPTISIYICSVMEQKFCWRIDCNELGLIAYLPVKTHVYFYVQDVSTLEQKKEGWKTYILMVNAVNYRPNHTLKSARDIQLDFQTVKDGQEGFVTKL